MILLERGRNIEHIKDYVNAVKDPWEFAHRGGKTQQMMKDRPVLNRDYPLNETNLDSNCNTPLELHRLVYYRYKKFQ